MNSSELLLSLLNAVYPVELSFDEMSNLTGCAKTSVARKILALKDLGMVRLRKTDNDCYCRVVREF